MLMEDNIKEGVQEIVPSNTKDPRLDRYRNPFLETQAPITNLKRYDPSVTEVYKQINTDYTNE